MTFGHKHRCPLTPGQLLLLTRTQWVSKMDYELLALYVELNMTHKETREGDCSSCLIILGGFRSILCRYFLSLTLADNLKQLAYAIRFMNIFNNVFFFPRPGVVITFCFPLMMRMLWMITAKALNCCCLGTELNWIWVLRLLRLFQNIKCVLQLIFALSNL